MTLKDLAGGGDSGGGSDGGGSDESTGEWISGLIDKLDDKDLLEPLVMNAAGIDPNAGQHPGERQADTNPAGAQDQPDADTGGGGDLDVEAVHGMLLKVYDYGPKIPGVSDDPTVGELAKLIDGNPEQAEQMLSGFMGDE